MPTSRVLIHPREELVQAISRIYRHRMTTTSGGNLSIRDANGDIWITPSGIDKGALTPDDIVCVKADGTCVGRHKPSMEYPFHKQIYAARPDVNAVVHAHSVALVAFSISRKVPNVRLFPQSHSVCGEVGYAPYALPGSPGLGNRIAASFATGVNCVILENHGVAVSGKDLAEAFQRFETLETTARIELVASGLGKLRTLDAKQRTLVLAPPDVAKEFVPGPATSREKELRLQLRDFVRRGYRQGLLTSTKGSFSARVDGNEFLITSYAVDRAEIEIQDLVLIRDGIPEKGKVPSRATAIHAAIYRKHPWVQSIVNAFPVYTTAFGVTDAPFDSRSIPESFIFLRDLPRLPLESRVGDGSAIADALGASHPAALLENDGCIVLGTNVLNAFDRLEVLESSAEAMANARPLGGLVPMGDAEIDELITAFKLPREG